MFQIDLKSRKAIYEQIIDNFKKMITTGVLKPDEKIPSVREMAKTLTCNPNTIQKAYRELETQGYFYTVLGQGSFISAPSSNDSRKKADSLFIQIIELVHEMEYLGVSRMVIAERILNHDTGTSGLSRDNNNEN